MTTAHEFLPHSATYTFLVRARSEESLNVTFELNGDIKNAALIRRTSTSMQIRKNTYLYIMSAVRFERTEEFELKLLGTQFKQFNDTVQPQGRIIVSGTGAPEKHVNVNVRLQPYASCKHTSVQLSSVAEKITHLATSKIQLVIVARDVDGFEMIQTQLNTESNTQLKVSLLHVEQNLIFKKICPDRFSCFMRGPLLKI